MSVKQTQRMLTRVLGEYEPKKPTWPALLGDGRGTVSVSGRPGWVYVRTGSDELPGQAFNNRTPLHHDLPVIVGYDNLQPDLFQVLSIREVYAGNSTGDRVIPQVPNHHGSHEFGAEYGGDDVVWVQKQQMVPLLAAPRSTPDMRITVYGDFYPWGDSWNWFEGATSADLTGHIPATGGKGIYVLVSIDGATNALQYTDGDEFNIALPPPDMGDLIPDCPAGAVPVVAVYLPNGVTSITWSNLFDVRMFNQPVGGSVTPAAHNLLDATTHTDTATDAPTQGSLVVGNATPAWDELVAGGAHQLLKMNAGATDPSWASFDWDDVAAAAAADMVHDHSAAGEGGQDLHDIQELRVAAATELTINAGVITRTQVYHSVDTEGDVASDDLDTINGGTEGDMLIIRPEDSARTIVVKTGTGNIVLSAGADKSLEDDTDHVLLVFDGSNWCDDFQVAGGGGGAPTDAEYLVLALDAGLSDERRFVPGGWLAATDGGANADYDLYQSLGSPAHLDNGTGAITEYATIQLALNACAQYDAVLVPPGVYVENLTWPSVHDVTLLGWPVKRSSLISDVYGAVLSGTLSVGAYRATVQDFSLSATVTLDGSTMVFINVFAWGAIADGGTPGNLRLLDSCIDDDVDVNNLDISNSWITGTITVAGAESWYGEVHWAETVGDHDHSGDAGDGGQLDWDDVWADAVHSHESDAEGGTLIVNGVTVTVKPGGGGDFTTIQDAIDWFAGKIIFGACVIDCDAGAYDEAVDFSGLLIAPGASLELEGDTRVLAGITYVDGADMNLAALANGGSGACSLSSAGTDITVVGATTNPDFDADGWVNGDRVLVYSNAGAVAIYTISSTLNNVITLAVAAPAIGNDGTAIALIPNRSIDRSAAGRCVQAVSVRGVILDGWYLESATGSNCNGVDASDGALVYCQNVLAHVEDYGYYALGQSSLYCNDGACSVWEGSRGIYIYSMSFGDAGYCVAVKQSAYGFMSYYMSYLAAVSTVAAAVTTYSYIAGVGAALNAGYGWNRACAGTGFYCQNNGFVFATNTNAKNSVPGAGNYNPAPGAIPGYGNGNGDGTIYVS